MLSHFPDFVKKKFRTENPNMRSWYLEALSCFMEVALKNSNYDIHAKKNKENHKTKPKIQNLQKQKIKTHSWVKMVKPILF